MLITFPRSALLAAIAATALFSAPATAQNLDASITCISGLVGANDYALFDQTLSESRHDRRGGVTLETEIGGVGLTVVDTNGESVCEETANNSTSCQFNLKYSVGEAFTVRVDNTPNTVETGFKVCSF